jgi:hypothetical protein
MASMLKRLEANKNDKKQQRKEHMDVGNYKNKQRTLERVFGKKNKHCYVGEEEK